MRSMTGKHVLQTLAGAALVLGAWGAQAGSVNAINGAMPNRISMNVTVPKQTQGATFGEKVNAGLQAAKPATAADPAIIIECGQAACAVVFPDGGVRADMAAMRFSPLDPRPARQLRRGAAGASLLGGALPGGGIVSAAVRAAPPANGKPGTSAAGMTEGPAFPSRSSTPGVVDMVDALPDGHYVLAVVVERATSGLKDTLKTQVRTAQPTRLLIEVGFDVEKGVAKASHDVAMNSIRNMR